MAVDKGNVEVKTPQDLKRAKLALTIAGVIVACGLLPVLAIAIGLSVRLFFWAAVG